MSSEGSAPVRMCVRCPFDEDTQCLQRVEDESLLLGAVAAEPRVTQLQQ